MKPYFKKEFEMFGGWSLGIQKSDKNTDMVVLAKIGTPSIIIKRSDNSRELEKIFNTVKDFYVSRFDDSATKSQKLTSIYNMGVFFRQRFTPNFSLVDEHILLTKNLRIGNKVFEAGSIVRVMEAKSQSQKAKSSYQVKKQHDRGKYADGTRKRPGMKRVKKNGRYTFVPDHRQSKFVKHKVKGKKKAYLRKGSTKINQKKANRRAQAVDRRLGRR